MTRLIADRLGAHITDRLLFQSISFTASNGEVLLVRGVNGAGKTTLLRQLAGLCQPSAGQVILKNTAFHEVFYLGHQLGLNPSLTLLENIQLHNPHLGYESLKQPKISALLHKFALEDIARNTISTFSAGQQKRFALLLMQISQATIWILDEPYVSLDKDGRDLLDQLILGNLENGGIIILATHNDLSFSHEITREIWL